MMIKAKVIEALRKDGLIKYIAQNRDKDYVREWTYQEVDLVISGIEPKFMKNQVIEIDHKWVRVDDYQESEIKDRKLWTKFIIGAAVVLGTGAFLIKSLAMPTGTVVLVEKLNYTENSMPGSPTNQKYIYYSNIGDKWYKYTNSYIVYDQYGSIVINSEFYQMYKEGDSVWVGPSWDRCDKPVTLEGK